MLLLASLEHFPPNSLELHYFLEENQHHIDAIVRHKCEREILFIAKEILDTLDIEADILIAPPKEGGFIDKWKFLKKNKDQLQILSPFAVIIIMQLLGYLPKPTSKLEELQIQSTQLDIEEKKLRIDKAKEELNNNSDPKEIIEVLGTNHKVIKHRSNFYSYLTQYQDVNKVSFKPFFEEQEIGTPIVIERDDFQKFILTSDELPTLIVKKAIIEIVSPVIKNLNYKWKGIYEGEVIDFNMSDSAFKMKVINKEISFENGFFIECNLEIKRRIDDFGEVKSFGYKVQAVTGQVTDDVVIETEQGKRIRHQEKISEIEKKQTKLF